MYKFLRFPYFPFSFFVITILSHNFIAYSCARKCILIDTGIGYTRHHHSTNSLINPTNYSEYRLHLTSLRNYCIFKPSPQKLTQKSVHRKWY